MPSSTSSSSSRLPVTPYGRLLLLAAAILAVLLAGSEVFWRTRGFLPSVVDSKVFWAMHRARASRGGNPKLVIIGASRAQLGIDPDVLEEEFEGYEVIHLAINGTSPYEVLKDLCLDGQFVGMIVCSTTVTNLSPAGEEKARNDIQYASYFQNEHKRLSSLRERLDTWFEANLQSRLAILSPALRLQRILAYGGTPTTMYLHMHYDRFRPAQYLDRTTPEQLANIRDRREPTEEKLRQTDLSDEGLDPTIGEELRALYDQLRSRGGELVLVRMPTTGRYWEVQERARPKALYWDRITDWSGIPTIHFLDYPELSAYDCPDTSHLDATDAPEFTRSLARIIESGL